jgi:hypothetical protein
MRLDWDTVMLICPHPTRSPLSSNRVDGFTPLPRRVAGLTSSSLAEPVDSRPSIKDASRFLTSVLQRGLAGLAKARFVSPERISPPNFQQTYSFAHRLVSGASAPDHGAAQHPQLPRPA